MVCEERREGGKCVVPQASIGCYNSIWGCFLSGREADDMPSDEPKGIDGLVWIVGGKSSNLATYGEDEGACGFADKLECRHWVPEAAYEDGGIEDEEMDELTDET
jgi:hypothetical protein